MRVLLTNDDGIRAPGIAALHDVLVDARGQFGGPLTDRSPGAVSRSPRSALFTVAPLTVQSATSHGVTFHEPLMTRDEPIVPGVTGVAVDGRPADCVKLALSTLWPERFGEGSRPDLVLSGINSGANCGINVIYSGTVAAALEAAFLGVPSIAVSLQRGTRPPRFDIAARWARETLERLLAHGLPGAHECLSVNLPLAEGADLPAALPLPPIKVCPMNTHGLVDRYERRVNPLGEVYYWAAGHGLDFHRTEPGSDVDELLRGCITVTPLRFDLTHTGSLGAWRERLEAHA